jgi:hypothetical protein
MDAVFAPMLDSNESMTRVLVATILVASLITQASAQQNNMQPVGLPFMSYGAGDRGCTDFLLARNGERDVSPGGQISDTLYTAWYAYYTAWVDGLLSDHNSTSNTNRNLGRYTNGITRMNYLEIWCREHSLDTFGSAVMNLVHDLEQTGR